jgi:hypothetical protein
MSMPAEGHEAANCVARARSAGSAKESAPMRRRLYGAGQAMGEDAKKLAQLTDEVLFDDIRERKELSK